VLVAIIDAVLPNHYEELSMKSDFCDNQVVATITGFYNVNFCLAYIQNVCSNHFPWCFEAALASIECCFHPNIHGRLRGHDRPKWNLPMKICRLSYFNCSNGRIYYENQKTVRSTVQQYTFWRLETHTHILTDLQGVIIISSQGVG